MRRNVTWRAFALLWAVLQFALPTVALRRRRATRAGEPAGPGAARRVGILQGVPPCPSGRVRALPGAVAHRLTGRGHGAARDRRRRPTLGYAAGRAAREPRGRDRRAPSSTAGDRLIGPRPRLRRPQATVLRGAPASVDRRDAFGLGARALRHACSLNRDTSMRILGFSMAALLLVAPLLGAQEDSAARSESASGLDRQGGQGLDRAHEGARRRPRAADRLGGSRPGAAPRASPPGRKAARRTRDCCRTSAPSVTSSPTSRPKGSTQEDGARFSVREVGARRAGGRRSVLPRRRLPRHQRSGGRSPSSRRT